MSLRSFAEASRRLRGVMLVAIVAVAGGCRAELMVAPPDLPASAQPLTPLSTYASWWSDVERCAGLSADLARVRWFVVPHADSFNYRGTYYDGYWWSQVHWITLADAKVQNAAIVRHEMLHDLLGRGDHPAVYFQQRCATVVACNEDCRADD